MSRTFPTTLRLMFTAALAAGALFAAAAPSEAKQLKQFVDQGGLADHCKDAGGTMGGDAGHYWCTAPGGEVNCVNDKQHKTCWGYNAMLADPNPFGPSTVAPLGGGSRHHAAVSLAIGSAQFGIAVD